MSIRKLRHTFATILLLLPFAATATMITIVPISGGDDGGSLGGYAMTDFAEPAGTDNTNPADDHFCVASPLAGNLCFEDQDGNPEGMDASSPDWWEWDGTPSPDHGNIYTADVSWVEIILPENTYAFSLWVGASFTGGAWIEAFDQNHASTGRTTFGVSRDNTEGYGVYSTDQCSTISRIIVEPDSWGFGHFSINQGTPCTQVPEPSTLALFGIGLFAVAIARRRRFEVVPSRK